MGAECIDAADPGRFLQNGLDHRQHRIGLSVDQLAGDAVTLGHPRAFIKQPRGFEKGREVDFHRFAAHRLQLLDGGGE